MSRYEWESHLMGWNTNIVDPLGLQNDYGIVTV